MVGVGWRVGEGGGRVKGEGRVGTPLSRREGKGEKAVSWLPNTSRPPNCAVDIRAKKTYRSIKHDIKTSNTETSKKSNMSTMPLHKTKQPTNILSHFIKSPFTSPSSELPLFSQKYESKTQQQQ